MALSKTLDSPSSDALVIPACASSSENRGWGRSVEGKTAGENYFKQGDTLFWPFTYIGGEVCHLLILGTRTCAPVCGAHP